MQTCDTVQNQDPKSAGSGDFIKSQDPRSQDSMEKHIAMIQDIKDKTKKISRIPRIPQQNKKAECRISGI